MAWTTCPAGSSSSAWASPPVWAATSLLALMALVLNDAVGWWWADRAAVIVAVIVAAEAWRTIPYGRGSAPDRPRARPSPPAGQHDAHPYTADTGRAAHLIGACTIPLLGRPDGR